jgi:single-strand DNA-binding protein
MSEDINRGFIVGRLVRDAELAYTQSGYAMCKMSIATNKSKKVGEQWKDEAHFFDAILWGRRGESLVQYLIKGQQVGIEYSLKQERWEKDGMKRSKVSLDVQNIQLLGSRKENGGYIQPTNQSQPRPQQNAYESYTPPSGMTEDDYDDPIPF